MLFGFGREQCKDRRKNVTKFVRSAGLGEGSVERERERDEKERQFLHVF